MSRKALLAESLAFSRNYTNGLLAKFESPEEWVHQAAPDTNHAMWNAGHIAHADNYFASLIDPAKAHSPDGYKEMFGMGSKPVNDASAYPAPAEILAYLEDRRCALLGILENLSDADLDRETPSDAPDFLPTVESVFRLASWHEGLHSGQTSVAHRALGKSPVMG